MKRERSISLEELRAGLKQQIVCKMGYAVRFTPEQAAAIARALEVARRVAELYDECPSCEGHGSTEALFYPMVGNGMIEPCELCFGLGVVPSEKGFEMSPYPLRKIACHLFGKKG